VAHLQIGLLLQQLGAPLEEDQERAGIYLTNGLTGWEPGTGKGQSIVMDSLRQESGEADAIKQGRKILVVLGNPPYNAFAGTSTQAEAVAEAEGLVDRYKEGLREKWGIKKYNLDDLYVRFFRIAERCVAEFRGEGMVCYISNFSYLNGDSFVVMREHFLREFDHIWLDNLNGDSRETGKRTPQGQSDPSVFSTEFNKAGIRKGTAICTMVRYQPGKRPQNPATEYRTFWGEHKRMELLDALESDAPAHATESQYAYQRVAPTPENRYCFRPLSVSATYQRWPMVTELCDVRPYNGPIERRGNSLIVYADQQDDLLAHVKAYLDSNRSDANIAALEPHFMHSSGEFDAPRSRELLLSKEITGSNILH
jgi:predicted helicase